MPTQAEIAFLKDQRIPESMVFHEGGLPKKIYKPIMKEIGACPVTGASPCHAAGHTIRTRAGHCAQCDTSKIAFQFRHSSPGFVYVASSVKLQLHKVGSAKDANKRLNSLNFCGYGGTDDWSLIYQAYSSHAGQAEFEVHSLLEQYRYGVRYLKEGCWVDCRETFRAPSAIILGALMSILT